MQEAEAVMRRIKGIHIEIDQINLALRLSLGCACKDIPEPGIKTVLQKAEKICINKSFWLARVTAMRLSAPRLSPLHEKSAETEDHSRRLESYCHAMARAGI